MVSARWTLLVQVFMFIVLVCWGPEAGAGLIDPLRPAASAEARRPEPVAPEQDLVQLRDRFKVTAILVGPGRAVAVVNGQRLQVGQMIEGYRLTEIRSDHVVLQDDRRQLRVSRSSGSTLRKSPPHQQAHR